ncbi:MAG: hypothetical protein IKQ62_08145 [Bacteroidaceae bacterium]|nr:hypothetical protein [Bacteroidaceae bacterium]
MTHTLVIGVSHTLSIGVTHSDFEATKAYILTIPTLSDGLETVESWAFSHCRHLNCLQV